MEKYELKQFQIEISKMKPGPQKTLMMEIARLALIGFDVEKDQNNDAMKKYLTK